MLNPFGMIRVSSPSTSILSFLHSSANSSFPFFSSSMMPWGLWKNLVQVKSNLSPILAAEIFALLAICFQGDPLHYVVNSSFHCSLNTYFARQVQFISDGGYTILKGMEDLSQVHFEFRPFPKSLAVNL